MPDQQLPIAERPLSRNTREQPAEIAIMPLHLFTESLEGLRNMQAYKKWALVGLAVSTVLALASPLGLIALGFTSHGPRARSYAAEWESAASRAHDGRIPPGSLFAAFEAAGAHGILSTQLVAASAALGAGIGMAGKGVKEGTIRLRCAALAL